MNTIYQYVQSGRVIDAYLKRLHLIKKENEYQHFLSRLKLTGYRVTLDDEVWDVKIKELEDLFSSTPEEIFKLALEQDTHGYLNDLKKHATPKIVKYIYYCRIVDVIDIFKRNNVTIPEELQHKIKTFLNKDLVKFICEISKNEYLRENEGTLAANGIGYILYLFDDDDLKKTIIDAFIDIYKYYIAKVRDNGLSNRNYVYGLTHCVIDVSEFYTRDVNDMISYFQDYYPIGELYTSTVTIICEAIKPYTTTGSTLNIKDISADMLAELLVVYKLLLKDYPSNKWYDFGYTISRTYQELCNRIDPLFGYIRDNKEEDPALDLKRNEHTNILFILYSRL